MDHNNYYNKSPVGSIRASQEVSSAAAPIPIDYSNDNNDNDKPQVGSIRASQEVSSNSSDTISPNVDPLSINTFNQSSATSPSPSSAHQALIRAKRASQEDFSSMVDNLSVSARLITAISLQNGLIDQSIPADKALAELLNIGSVDMDKLEHFDKTKVDDFMTKLQNLGTTIKAPSSLASVQKTSQMMAGFTKEYAKLGDIKDKGPVDAYFTVIQGLNADKFDFTFLTSIVQPLKDVINFLAVARDMSEEDVKAASDVTVFSGKLVELRNHLVKLEAPLNELKKLNDVLGKYDPFLSNDFPENSRLRKTYNLLDLFYLEEVPLVKSDMIQEVTDSFTATAKLATDRNACSNELSALEMIARDRRSSASARTFTSGFINGHSELGTLATDIQTPSFKALADGYDVKKLGTALEPLKLLETELAAVESAWSSLTDVKQVSTVRAFVRIHKQFDAVETVSSQASAILDSLKACVETKVLGKEQFYTNAAKVVKSAAQLRKTLSTVKARATLPDHLATVISIKDLIKPGQEMSDKQVLLGVINSVKNFAGIESIANGLAELVPKLDEITQLIGQNDVNALFQAVLDGKPTIDKFFADTLIDTFITFFTCTDKLTVQLDTILTAMSTIQDALKLDAQHVNDLSAVTTTIGSSIPAVKKLRAVPATIRANKDASAELVKLKDLGKESETFGQSVAALDNVRKVLEKKADLEQFLKDCEAVKAEIQKLTDPNQKSELLADWGDFQKTKTKVTDLLIDLESRRNKIAPVAIRRRRSIGGFSKFTSLFSGFTGLTDADLEVENRQKVLAALAPSVPSMATLKGSLDSLGSLDLNFASSNGPLSRVTAALGNLDNVFKSAVATGSATLSPSQKPPPAGQNQNPNNTTQTSPPRKVNTTTEASTSPEWLPIVGYSVLGCIVVGGIVGVICYYFGLCCGQNKDKGSTNTTTANKSPVDQDGELENQGAALEEQNKQLIGENEHEKQLRIKAEQDKIKAEQERVNAADELAAVVRRHGKEHGHLYEYIKNGSRVELRWKMSNEDRFIDLPYVAFLDSYGWRRGYPGNDINDVLDTMKIVTGKTLMSQYYDAKAMHVVPQRVQLLEKDYFLRVRGWNTNYLRDPLNAVNKPEWIHANVMIMPVYGSIVIAQGPLKAGIVTRVIEDGVVIKSRKVDTRSRFLNWIMMHNMPHIVMTCGINECDPYFTADKPGIMQIGDHKVIVKTSKKMFNGEVVRRDLQISRKDAKKTVTHNCVHWQFTNWPEGGGTPWSEEYPHFIDGFNYVQDQTQKTHTHKNPTMVHGALGTGRSGIFVAVQWLYQALHLKKNKYTMNCWVMLAEMRSHRLFLIDNGYQLYFTIVAFFDYFVKSCKKDQKDREDLPGYWGHIQDFYKYDEYEDQVIKELLGVVASKKEVTKEKTVGDEKKSEKKSEKKKSEKKSKKEVAAKGNTLCEEEEAVKKEEPKVEKSEKKVEPVKAAVQKKPEVMKERPDYPEFEDLEFSSERSTSIQQKRIAAKEEREKKKKSQDNQQKAIRRGETDVSMKLAKSQGKAKSVKKAPKDQDTLKSEKK